MEVLTNIAGKVTQQYNKGINRFKIGRDGRDQRKLTKLCFRGCASALVSKDEIVTKLLQQKMFRDPKYSSHPFLQIIKTTTTSNLDNNTITDNTLSSTDPSSTTIDHSSVNTATITTPVTLDGNVISSAVNSISSSVTPIVSSSNNIPVTSVTANTSTAPTPNSNTDPSTVHSSSSSSSSSPNDSSSTVNKITPVPTSSTSSSSSSSPNDSSSTVNTITPVPTSSRSSASSNTTPSVIITNPPVAGTVIDPETQNVIDTNNTNTNTSSSSSSLYDQYMPILEVCSSIADVLGWSAEKRTEKNYVPFRKLCFKCPSTHVSTKEFAKLIYESDIFGVEVDIDYIPARDEEPTFVNHDLFVLKSPLRVTWPQVENLYIEWVSFAKKLLDLDKMFLKLQEAAFLQRKDKAGTSSNRHRQMEHTDVPIITFVQALTAGHFFPKDSPVWTSEAYLEWSAVDDFSLTISWDDVYYRLRESAPQIKSSSEAFSALIQEEEMKQEQLRSQENSTNQPSSSADDATSRVYVLELQMDQYKQHTDSLTQENQALRERVTLLEEVNQSLKLDGQRQQDEVTAAQTDRDQYLEHIRQLQQSQRDQAAVQIQLQQTIKQQQDLLNGLNSTTNGSANSSTSIPTVSSTSIPIVSSSSSARVITNTIVKPLSYSHSSNSSLSIPIPNNNSVISSPSTPTTTIATTIIPPSSSTSSNSSSIFKSILSKKASDDEVPLNIPLTMGYKKQFKSRRN